MGYSYYNCNILSDFAGFNRHSKNMIQAVNSYNCAIVGLRPEISGLETSHRRCTEPFDDACPEQSKGSDSRHDGTEVSVFERETDFRNIRLSNIINNVALNKAEKNIY
jgi:hypothetical protein